MDIEIGETKSVTSAVSPNSEYNKTVQGQCATTCTKLIDTFQRWLTHFKKITQGSSCFKVFTSTFIFKTFLYEQIICDQYNC